MADYAANPAKTGARGKADDVEIIQQERKRWLLFGLPFTFTKYTLTNRKLLINEGLLTSKENEILLYRVLDITLQRTLLQKIFSLGTVIIESQDRFQPHLVVKNIKNAQMFKDNLSDAVEEEKMRLHMRRGEIIGDDHGPYAPDAYDRNDAFPDAVDDSFRDGFDEGPPQ